MKIDLVECQMINITCNSHIVVIVIVVVVVVVVFLIDLRYLTNLHVCMLVFSGTLAIGKIKYGCVCSNIILASSFK